MAEKQGLSSGQNTVASASLRTGDDDGGDVGKCELAQRGQAAMLNKTATGVSELGVRSPSQSEAIRQRLEQGDQMNGLAVGCAAERGHSARYISRHKRTPRRQAPVRMKRFYLAPL